MTNPSLLKQSIKFSLYFIGLLIAIFALTRLGLGLIGTQTDILNSLNNVSNSPFIAFFRLAIYILIFWYWKKLLNRINPNLSERFISSSRRPLLILIVMYEVIIVQQWQSILIGAAN